MCIGIAMGAFAQTNMEASAPKITSEQIKYAAAYGTVAAVATGRSVIPLVSQRAPGALGCAAPVVGLVGAGIDALAGIGETMQGYSMPPGTPAHEREALFHMASGVTRVACATTVGVAKIGALGGFGHTALATSAVAATGVLSGVALGTGTLAVCGGYGYEICRAAREVMTSLDTDEECNSFAVLKRIFEPTEEECASGKSDETLKQEKFNSFASVVGEEAAKRVQEFVASGKGTTEDANGLVEEIKELCFTKIFKTGVVICLTVAASAGFAAAGPSGGLSLLIPAVIPLLVIGDLVFGVTDAAAARLWKKIHKNPLPTVPSDLLSASAPSTQSLSDSDEGSTPAAPTPVLSDAGSTPVVSTPGLLVLEVPRNECSAFFPPSLPGLISEDGPGVQPMNLSN